jgi:flagellar protein FliJ
VNRGRFHFRLERVRALREQAEDEAREALAAAMAERDRWALRLAEAAQRLSVARSVPAGGSVGALLASQAFVERCERELVAAELDLSRQDAEVDARRVALQAAARERQVLDQLRDKQQAVWQREHDRRESEQLDELALAGFTRRSAAA